MMLMVFLSILKRFSLHEYLASLLEENKLAQDNNIILQMCCKSNPSYSLGDNKINKTNNNNNNNNIDSKKYYEKFYKF